MLLTQFFTFDQELIDLGAKRIIVPGNFPVGCMTIYLALFRTNDSTMYDELNCLRTWNEFAIFHNDRLQNAVKGLQKEHPNVIIVYGDYYAALTWILRHASSLGKYLLCIVEGGMLHSSLLTYH